MIGVQIHEPESARMRMRQRFKHLIVLVPKLLWRWVVHKWVAHEQTDAIHTDTVGHSDQLRHFLAGSPTRKSVEVNVQVPNFDFALLTGNRGGKGRRRQTR